MKSVVLLSGGLDSVINLHLALEKGKVALALTFNYAQRAANRETDVAASLCRNLKIKHAVVELPFFKDFGKSSLIDQSLSVPVGEQVQIDSLSSSQESAKSVWVPNRNGIFLNIAAGFCEALDASNVVCGFNLEEAQTFPDNSQLFLEQTNAALKFSTKNQVQATSFTVAMNKTEIVKEGLRLGVNWNLLWPCYLGGENWCRVCESCQRTLRAFAANGVVN